jgi:hypothetical protein
MTGNHDFETFFRTLEPARDKYLSRLFGLFSEQVVRIWCACPQSPYADLGRPTLYIPGIKRGHTIDFTLRNRDTGKKYVAELKCELEYENYKYLRLTHPGQLRHHTSIAFAKLLQVATNPTALDIRCKGQPISVDGAILVWGTSTSDGRNSVMAEYGFADVLSLEAMLADLQAWVPNGWSEIADRHRRWTNELFDFLGET